MRKKSWIENELRKVCIIPLKTTSFDVRARSTMLLIAFFIEWRTVCSFGRSLFFSKFIKLPRFFLIPRIKRKTKQKIRRNRREKKKLLLFLPLAVFVLCWLLREQHFLKIWKMKSINRECKKNWRIEKSSNWLQLYTERWRMKSRQKSKNDAQWKCEHYLCGE